MTDPDWTAERRAINRRIVDAEFDRLGADARAARAERASAEAEARATYAEAYAKGVKIEIDALRASTSWRVTAPIRAISRLFGAGGRIGARPDISASSPTLIVAGLTEPEPIPPSIGATETPPVQAQAKETGVQSVQATV